MLIMIQYAMLCYGMVCYGMLWYAMLCYAILRYASLRFATLCYSILDYRIILYYHTLCFAMLCYATLWADVIRALRSSAWRASWATTSMWSCATTSPTRRGVRAPITSRLAKSCQSSSVIAQGVSPGNMSPCVDCRLVATFYGSQIDAEQEHVRQSCMSRVKHPMLRLSQNVTT